MDSMRSLNTSLPRTTPRRQAAGPQTPEDILSAFKAAALSVTTLYRAAANDQVRSRAAGYQDALDDLLAFLDKENIGLGDGEGWRVRQWATERLDGSERAENDEDEEEVSQEEERIRHQSPEQVRETTQRQLPDQMTQLQQQTAIPSEASTTVPSTISGSNTQQHPTTPPAFIFRSSYSYPTNHDREMNMDNSNDAEHEQQTHETQPETPMRMEVPPKQRARQNRNNNSRSSNSNRALGSGAGTKRRVPFDDFFNISGVNFDTFKDGSDRGGKRGRHV